MAFGFYNSGITLNGKGLGGDSGGAVFDPTGDLTGLVIGQWGGTDAGGGTDILVLSQADVSNWVSANTQVTPEPGTLVLLAAATGTGCLMFGRKIMSGQKRPSN